MRLCLLAKITVTDTPTEEVLIRLRDTCTLVFRTDLQGDIIAVSDGTNITITTEKNETVQTNETAVEPEESGYIGNKNTKKSPVQAAEHFRRRKIKCRLRAARKR